MASALAAAPDAPRASRAVWLAALAVALVLHGGALAYVWLGSHAVEEEDTLGAPAIEIGVELAAPRQEEQPDLPPGPEADDAAAAAPSAKQTVKQDQPDLPKATPDEAEDAARQVATDPPKKPADETPKVTESKADPSIESAASEAAAPPKVETPREAPTVVAPDQGSGAVAQKIRTTWQKTLAAHLNRFKRYPHAAPHGVTVTITFTLDRLGHVAGASIVKGSGDATFDRAALDMMTRADPVPAPPPLVADESLSFTLPVIFKDRR